MAKLSKLMKKNNMTYKSYTSYKTYQPYLVLFVLLFFFFVVPAKPAHAATLSRPPSNLGLVGYWSMDEGRGNYAGDSSGANTSAIIYGTPQWVNGKRATALEFNGTSDYLITPLTNNVYAISLWVYINSSQPTGGWNYLLDARYGHGGGYFANFGIGSLWSGGSMYVNGVAKEVSWANLPQNQWFHLYLQAGTTFSDDVNFMSRVSNNEWLKGKLDDIKFYSRTLSPSEIFKIYSSGQTTIKKVSEQGLVGYWALNDSSGNKAGDSSGNGNTGTITGATWVNGKRGKALSFNGVNSYIDVDLRNKGLVGSQTISAWVKTSGPPSGKPHQTVLATDPTYQYGIKLMTYKNVDRVGLWLGTGTTNYEAFVSKNVNDGQWHFVSGIYNYTAGTVTMFIDGVTYSPVSSGQMVVNVSDIGKIGRDYHNSDYSYNGIIDDVRIYNRALSVAEIQSLYKQNETIANAPQNDKLTNGLVGFWSFNGKDVSGSTAYDRSGKNRNATIVGATLDAGKVGQAINFNGASQYVVSGGTFSELGTSNQPYSFAGWVKVAPNETDGNIIHMASGSGGVGWCLPPVALVSGKLRGYSWNGGGVSVTGTTSLRSDTWYFFVNTWDATNGLRIYVNGVLENSTAMANYSASGASNYLWLSFDPGGCAGTNGDFDGLIDEARVYNRALTPSEVKQLYNMGR